MSFQAASCRMVSTSPSRSGRSALRSPASGCAEVDLEMLAQLVFPGAGIETRQVGALRVGAALESPGLRDQVRYAQVAGQRIAPGTRQLPLDQNGGRVDAQRVPLNQDAVARLEQHVVERVARERCP